MPPHGEYGAHQHDSGARRRLPTHQQQQQQYQPQRPVPMRQQSQEHQQYPQQRPQVPPSHQQRPQQRPPVPPTHHHQIQQKRRDTNNSTNSQQPKRPRVRFAPPLAAPMLSQVATMSGYLRKQADNEPGKWTKYYFVLKPTTYLYYYTTDRDAEPRGIIDAEFLKDVRFNADCVQRSVGGSAHGFRVTGQLPAKLCTDGKDPNKTQFRPLYLDADSRDQADAWMEAIRHHRFDLARHRDYDDLLDSMDEVEEQLTTMTQQTKELGMVARQVLTRSKELVCALRGVDMNDTNGGRPRGMSHADDDVGATVASIGLLVDELFAEADRQRRLAEMLRQREGEALQNNTQLKECQAELTIQQTRCKRFETEVENLRDEMRMQQQGYDTRYGELVARERQVLAREKELLTQIKEREKLCDQRMAEVELKSSKWTKELEKEAARRNGELEKKRKALEKQQKALDAKQKTLDKRLQENPAPSKLRFAVGAVSGAIGKARSVATTKEVPVEEHHHEYQDDDEDDEEDEVVPVKAARSKSRFGRPGFLKRKKGGASSSAAAHESDHDDEPDAERSMPSEKDGEIESDYFDARVELATHGRSRAATTTQFSSDRSSDASTTRLSGGSYYSSSINTQHSSRSARSHTTSGLPPTLERTRSATRAASVPAANGVSGEYGSSSGGGGLPSEWTYKESKKFIGRFYYYNRLTGETRWEFPYDAVVATSPAAATAMPMYALPRESGRYSSRYGVARESSRASSVDDGNDFMTSNDDAEREDISAFLNRTRANSHRVRPVKPTPVSSSGSWSTRDKLPPPEAEATSDPTTKVVSWEAKYYSDAAMATRMGFVREEPEDDDDMGTIQEDESFHASRRFGRKGNPSKTGHGEYDAGLATTSTTHEPVDAKAGKTGKTTGKGWKLMPKVPFRRGKAKSKGKVAMATSPQVPRDTDPIVHDNGRHEF